MHVCPNFDARLHEQSTETVIRCRENATGFYVFTTRVCAIQQERPVGACCEDQDRLPAERVREEKQSQNMLWIIRFSVWYWSCSYTNIGGVALLLVSVPKL